MQSPTITVAWVAVITQVLVSCRALYLAVLCLMVSPVMAGVAAYCKNLVNGLWYHLDDSSATRVQESDLKTTAAYVLFYRRRKPAAPPS